MERFDWTGWTTVVRFDYDVVGSGPPVVIVAVTRPVVNLVGGASSLRFADGADIVQRLLPHALRHTIPGADHLLIADHPGEVAERLDAFWSTR